MAEEKKVEVVEEATEKKVKKTSTRKTSKKAEAKKEEAKKAFAKPTLHDYEVIVNPVITEKSMALIQNNNKVTVRVSDKANKVEIKAAFERIFQVKVVSVRINNVPSKSTTRGGRYKGTISGYKKAIVTIEEGAAIDLFKE